MGKNYLFLVFMWIANLSQAQLHEVGISFGGSNYAGDIGSTTLIRPNATAYGILYKYNKNPRIAYRASITSMGIKADNADSSDKIRQLFDVTVDKRITEFTAGIEFNFFEFNFSHWKRPRTPYFIFELAFFQYEKAEGIATDYSYKSKIGVAFPFGFGYKAQISDHFIVGIETRIRYTFTDDLDDSLFYKEEVLKNHPENSKFNNPDTNDWYAFTGITLTYTFGRPLYYTTKRN
jgi:hypothetical protein